VKIATLSIGDELVFGEVVDTNAAAIAGRLYAAGLKVQRHLTVGDVEPDIVEAIQTLADKSDAVIVTGGLGPTIDDITARAAAKATGRRLVLNEDALAHVKEVTEKLGGGAFSLNEKQALFPAKALAIANPVGTACGFHLVHSGSCLYFLPGVPGEMGRMLDEAVIPLILEKRRDKTVVRTRVLKVFGPSEAEVDSLVKGMAAADSGVTIAFCVNFPEILVKLRAGGDDERRVTEALGAVTEKVRQRLGRYIYAEEGETIDSVVAALFRAKGVTLSLAESCTGGLVAKRITDMSGSSAYFLEGAVTYANAAKIRTLDVSPRLLEENGAVSPEVAMAMARGMRSRTGSDIALAVTGIAGPEGGSADKPVGTVFLALAGRDGCRVKGYNFFGDRGEIRTITSFTAMDWLRRYLLSL
jgi:nicotinamide-nucleotide amidase